jgi:hypothetical protein
LPGPGPILALAEHPILPVFRPSSMPEEATPRTILSWGSTLLRGFTRSLCPKPIGDRAPLLGFLAPSTRKEEGVHVSPETQRAPRFCRGVHLRVPPRRLRCRSQVFSTSQRPSSSLHPPAIFQAGGVPGVSPFRGFFPPRSPNGSSPPACPPDVSPLGRPYPLPRRGNLGAHSPGT